MNDAVRRGAIGSVTGSRLWDLILVGLAAAVIGLLIAWPFVHMSLNGDHYVYLARHFVRGSLNVDDLPSIYGDDVIWRGHKYVPFGPLPAVLLVPFLPLTRAGVPIVVAAFCLTIVNVLVFYRALERAAVADERRYWVTLLYFAGTVYLSVTLVGISTYFAHVVVTALLLLAVYEMLGRRRLALIGILVGLAGAARLTAVFSLPFFIWIMRYDSVALDVQNLTDQTMVSSPRARVLLRRLSLLLGGVALPMLLVGLYNYARFGNLFDTGFGRAEMYEPFLEKARSAGLFSLAHVPKNLFVMLLQGPQLVGGVNVPVVHFPYIEPSPWGMGLFFTSPALVYVFRAKLKEPLVQACWLATLSVLVPIITYYGIGFVQFGYRYALDFMPFLLLLVARGFPRPVTNSARILVVISVLINVWGAVTLSTWI